MSFTGNKTYELWQNFMSRRREINNSLSSNLYSVEVYDSPAFFEKFDPAKEFEKWAAVPVTDFSLVPEGLHTLVMPEGKYAVFPYKGKPSEVAATYQYIYSNWIPNSPYRLDNRPHFAVMGEKYKGEHPESEEEIWVPVKG